MKDKLLGRLEDYYNQYVQYNEYFEKYIDSIKDKENDFAALMEKKPTVKALKEIGMELFVVKFQYAQDLQVLSEKFVTILDTVVIAGVEVPEEMIDLAKQLRPILRHTNFIIDGGKLVEKEVGFIDTIKENIEESGKLDVMLKDMVKNSKKKKK